MLDEGHDEVLILEDDAIVAIDKPPGLAVHRSQLVGDDDDYVVDRVRRQTGRTLYLAHRLDRATSGVLLFAASFAGALLAPQGTGVAVWWPAAGISLAAAAAIGLLPTWARRELRLPPVGPVSNRVLGAAATRTIRWAMSSGVDEAHELRATATAPAPA